MSFSCRCLLLVLVGLIIAIIVVRSYDNTEHL